jgi:acetyl esterase/lipase
MHFHGGGFVFGTLASEDAICARIAVSVGVVVVNVNYRHAPEFTYPTAWNDAQDAFVWLHGHLDEVNGDGQKVVLGGISAGSRLVSSLVLEKHLGRVAAGCPDAIGQVLMIPSLVHADCYEPQLKKMKDRSISSYAENENAPILPMSKIMFFEGLLGVDNADDADTKFNPGNATPEEVKGLPPTVFGIAGLDPLRDEGLLYAKMLTEAGCVTFDLFTIVHTWMMISKRLTQILVFLLILVYLKVFLMVSAVLATGLLQVKDGTMLLMKA